MTRPFFLSSLRRTFLNDRRGFSAIEMIVVVSVSIVLAAMALGWSAASRNQVALTVDRTHIIQLLQRAKSLSLSTFSSTSPACGYGLTFIGNSYNLIRYVDPVCTSGLGAGGSDEVVETAALSPGVQFTTGPNQVVRAIFIPPDPKVFLYQSSGAALTDGFIYLTIPGGTSTSTIHIGAGGAIEF